MKNDRRFSIRLGFSVIGILLLTNLPPLHWMITFGHEYTYITRYGDRFNEMQNFAPTFKDVNSNFNRYLKANPSDKTLYRTFKINPLKFWLWSDFLFHPRYQLPYFEPDKILPYPANWPDSLKSRK